jgi:hypothetical protein
MRRRNRLLHNEESRRKRAVVGEARTSQSRRNASLLLEFGPCQQIAKPGLEIVGLSFVSRRHGLTAGGNQYFTLGQLVLRKAIAFLSKLYDLIRHNDHAFGFLQLVIGLLNSSCRIVFHAPQSLFRLSQLRLVRAHLRSAFAEVENIPVHVESEFAKVP